MSLRNACSERCGWCGRCSAVDVPRGKHELTRETFAALRRGFMAAGLPGDYFDAYDITYLWDQGKNADQIVATAVEHEDRAKRLQRHSA